MNAAINFGKKQCSGSTIFSFARQRGFISLSQPAKLGEGIYRSKSAKTSAHNALRSFSTEEKTVTKRAPSAENERLSLVDGELSKELKQLSDDILNLNSVDMTLLLEIVQAKLGLSPEVMENLSSGSGIGGFSGGGGGAAAAAAAAPVVAAEPVKEKDAFDIKLTVVDPKSKIKIIKEVRALTGLGLKEAKDLVEKAPCVIKQGVKKEEVEAIKKILTDAGATIEII